MLNYLFTYSWKVEKPAAEGKAQFACSAASPISAISLFHRKMQTEREMASDRKTIKRPALRPDQYKVERMDQTYYDSSKQFVYSQLDYPGSPNPDVLYHNQRRLEEGAGAGAENTEFDLGSAQGVVKGDSKCE